MSASFDVAIIGAGVAGLTASRELSQSGLRVLLLEGRERIGGRILTHHTPHYPVELGAEFIHGRPSETFQLVKEAGLKIAELRWNPLRRRAGQWLDAGKSMAAMEELFESASSDQADQSIQSFVDYARAEPEVKEMALAFVEGFHAADPRRISLHSVIRSAIAEEQIDGDRQYRIAAGYDTAVRAISDRIDWKRCDLRLQTCVTEVKWKPGSAVIRTSDGLELRAPRAIITVPLGVLKSGRIRFNPSLADKEQSFHKLEMGPVIRASLCFRGKFWESEPRFKDMSFLFSDDPHFPTWWTGNPLPFPMITGWAAGHYARELGGQGSDSIINTAVQSLANIFGMDARRVRGELEGGFTHDWQADPFSAGAYSYALVDGADAGAELALPLEKTLFFAGEATVSDGHNGTVHGAIASGHRVAREICGP